MAVIEISFNGEPRSTESRSVIELLKEYNLEGRKIAVERNREIVQRSAYGDTPLVSGDRIEIVQFVGGG